MFEVGRICVKIAGRDAGKKCVVIDVVDDVYVMIDGQTRRRKCNVVHLEPQDLVVKIKKNASNKDVASALNKEKIDCQEKKAPASKDKKERPKKTKSIKVKPEPKKKKSDKKAKTEKKAEEKKPIEKKEAENPKVAPKK